MLRPLFAAVTLLSGITAAPLLHAQARVVDSEPLSSAAQNTDSGTPNVQAELFYQFQALQQEVQELRGLVEEQSNEIRQLKQQRMDDYLDLDRRIGELSQGGLGGGGLGAAGSEAAGQSNRPSGDGSDRVSETEMYRKAYELLRDREIDSSIESFNAYLEAYPKGNFAGNSHYWLGEIYLLKEDLGEAQRWFEKLLREFPEDRKRADAQYKLGRVYHQQGESDKAKSLLEDVATGNSDAARLARQAGKLLAGTRN